MANNDDWLVQRLENLVADVRNGDRVDLAEQAEDIRRYTTEEREQPNTEPDDTPWVLVQYTYTTTGAREFSRADATAWLAQEDVDVSNRGAAVVAVELERVLNNGASIGSELEELIDKHSEVVDAYWEVKPWDR